MIPQKVKFSPSACLNSEMHRRVGSPVLVSKQYAEVCLSMIKQVMKYYHFLVCPGLH